MINNNLFNTDRGLIQADNGILRENINLNVKAPQLQQNPLQQFFEGPDVFGGFKVDNYANDLAFIKSVQNQRDETKELDSSLFAPFEGVDNDISQRMLIDDIKNSAVNYMAQEADDGMQEAHQSLINSNKFINQIQLIDPVGEDKKFQSSSMVDVLQMLASGKAKLNLPSEMNPEVKKLLADIIANPKDIMGKANDIMRFLPEISTKLWEFVEFVEGSMKDYKQGFAR